MNWSLFNIIPKKFVGIDIGTSSIKVVELLKWGERIKLENYGEIKAEMLFKKPFRTFKKNTLAVETKDVAKSISALLEETNIKTKKVSFSIPDFSSFFTWFKLPSMTEEELPEAVRYAARQHIPLPLSEVILDWQIIEGSISGETEKSLKVLLVAVPKEVINQYQEITSICELELQNMEAEVFGLVRAVAREEHNPIVLVDIGAQSTTVNIIDRKILKRSHSFDTSGNELTAILAKGLGVDYKKAEQLKRKYGISSSPFYQEESLERIKDVLFPLIDLIIREVDRASKEFYRTEKREIKKIIVSGGASLMPGLVKYFSKNLEKAVEVGNPFSDIFYPPILEKELKKMGPSYAIATGLALKGLE
ncbi:MAG TPA: type IV pilus assembly protein PilM [bacterium]|nr:type IV pilus assembly protein PilM [bacterium]